MLFSQVCLALSHAAGWHRKPCRPQACRHQVRCSVEHHSRSTRAIRHSASVRCPTCVLSAVTLRVLLLQYAQVWHDSKSQQHSSSSMHLHNSAALRSTRMTSPTLVAAVCTERRVARMASKPLTTSMFTTALSKQPPVDKRSCASHF
jgi:hypothetical protein